MDGPNVNLKFFKEFAADFKEDNFCSLVGIGSLHIGHSAFKTGPEKLEWGLKKFFKAAYTILHDSPGRREDYESHWIFKVSIKFLYHTVIGTFS